MGHISKISVEKSVGWGDVAYVESVAFYRNDVVLHYRMKKNLNEIPRGKKSDITQFSRKSRMTLAFIANNSPIEFSHMITLTYPADYETDGKIVKKHLNRFLAWCRTQVRPFSYLWFLEWQRRGAPHFHILVCHSFNKTDVSQRWYDAVASLDPKHLGAGTRVEKIRKKEGARRYAVKYASKTRQKKVPKNYRNVGRFFGYSRDVKPQPIICANNVNLSRIEILYWLSDWSGVTTIDENPIKTLYNASHLKGDLQAMLDEMNHVKNGTY